MAPKGSTANSLVPDTTVYAERRRKVISKRSDPPRGTNLEQIMLAVQDLTVHKTLKIISNCCGICPVSCEIVPQWIVTCFFCTFYGCLIELRPGGFTGQVNTLNSHVHQAITENNS